MTVIQTLLVFVGIPLLVTVLLTIGVYGRSAVHQPNRYRPGRPWLYPPQWYVPHPQAIADAGPDRIAIGGSSEPARATGGASGEW